jgi:hypothetical protein
MSLWNKKAQFPVSYVALEGFTDDTNTYAECLQTVTPLIHDVFLHLSTGSNKFT